MAFFAGTVNSVAGGGSFFSFPALVLAGVPPISANATNNAAMWVGTLGSAHGYREELRPLRRILPPAIIVSLIGSVIGAMLLLHTPSTVFERMIPWLLLFAIIIFAISPYLRRKTASSTEDAPAVVIQSETSVASAAEGRAHTGWQLAMQFCVAVYGGYFGAGIGYLMLAILSFSGLPNMNAMNGVKNVLAACINGIALVPFILARVVDWKYAVLMAIAAVIGGYAGSRIFRRVPSRYTRAGVILLGSAMTAYFFLKR